MNRDELLARRWAAQALHQPALTAAQVVARLLAVQAQDPKMVLAAVAMRGQGLRAVDVAAALDSGTLLRTHVLRPTWHLVAADDLRWLTALTADRIRAAAGSNQRSRGVTAEVLRHSESVLAAAVQGGPQTREVLVEAMVAAGLAVDENRASHYLMNAEVALLLCSGPKQGSKPTYDLVARRVPAAPPVPRDEALARLAQRYIAGHGPATEADFAWWSGLNLGDARRGLASAQGLTRGEHAGQPVWFDPSCEPIFPYGLNWLPAYDEFLIAYADRSAAISAADAARWVTKNGVFYPVVVANGRVVGRWLRPDRPKAAIGVEWFADTPAGADQALATFGKWWQGFGPG